MIKATSLVDYISNSNWEFENADTKFLTHNIHRYSGKFIPQIAERAIKLLTLPYETVFDPYLGSGTTALESILNQRDCIGVDINPLATLISQVKTTVLPSDVLRSFFQDLIDSINFALNPQMSLIVPKYVPMELVVERDDRYNNAWNQKWYQAHVLRQLIAIYNVIDCVPEDNLKRIAQVAFSDILRKSSNANSHYPNVMYDKNAKEKPLPIRFFVDSMSNVTSKLISLSEALYGVKYRCDIICGNNTSLSLDSSIADAIITHPPYIAAIPYAEYGCLSLEWLGYSSKALDAELTGGKRHKKDVVERFRFDYIRMFEESYRILKHGKYAFFLVGNPTSNGIVIDLHQMTIECGKASGYEYITSGIRRGTNRRGNMMGFEYLVFMRKP